MIRALLLSATVVVACRSAESASGPVDLRLDRSTYRPGDTVRLTLSNATPARYAYNPCTRVLQRQVGAEWEVAESDRICTMEAWILEGRATAAATTTLPTDLPAGSYRLVLALTQEGGTPVGIEATSPAFAVQP